MKHGVDPVLVDDAGLHCQAPAGVGREQPRQLLEPGHGDRAGHERRVGRVDGQVGAQHHRPDVAGELRPRLLYAGGVRGAAGDDHQLAGVRGVLGGPTGGVQQVTGSPHRETAGVEHRSGGSAHLLATAGEGEGEVVLREAHHHRGGDAHRQLELGGPGVGLGAFVDQHDDMAAPGVVVLPDVQLTGPRRRPPVHVAQVVAADVLAQGMEREVAHRDLVARRALEVAHEADAECVDRDHPRPDEEIDRRRPGRPADR